MFSRRWAVGVCRWLLAGLTSAQLRETCSSRQTRACLVVVLVCSLVCVLVLGAGFSMIRVAVWSGADVHFERSS